MEFDKKCVYEEKIKKVGAEMDREKVIKGWECHMEADTLGCADCPYRQGWRTCNFADTLFNDVYAMLKEQEAVEPNVSSAEQRCGNCNKVIEMDVWQSCPWCGKRIDWKGWWKKNGTRNQDS